MTKFSEKNAIMTGIQRNKIVSWLTELLMSKQSIKTVIKQTTAYCKDGVLIKVKIFLEIKTYTII